ncbi:MAG: sulfatase-like hydrolase/transferase [Bacteroidales bacterium]|nr:sulfatase-like hydrolase/transferase [Bacteroidales bacterium]
MAGNLLKTTFQRSAFTKEDTLIFKGIGILLIVFHNFLHWVGPYTGENEFNFQLSRINNFFNGIAGNPTETIHLFFSYFGHYGVQLFFFISGYGLMRAYGNKYPGYSGFVGSRLKKLYPAYIIAIILFIIYNLLVFGISFNLIYFRDVVLQLTFLNNFIPDFIFRLNGPWWFYSVIVQLYLIFPLLILIHKHFRKYGLLILFFVWIILNALLYKTLLESGLNTYYTFAGHLPVFLLGLIWASRKQAGINLPLVFVAAIIFVLGNYYEVFWYFSQAAIVILMVSLIALRPQKIRLRGSFKKLILFYGGISMYLFAVHGFLRKPLVGWANDASNPWITLLLALLFVIIATLVALGTKKTEAFSGKLIHWINALKKPAITHSNYIIKAIRFNFPEVFRISFAFYFCLLAIRVYEFFLYRGQHMFSAVSAEDFFTAISVDLALSLGLSAVFIIIYSILPFRKAIIARILHIAILFILLLVYMGTIQYYNTTLDMLDHVVYVYSFSALKGIASSSAELNLSSILPFIVFPLIFAGVLFMVRKWKISPATTVILIILGFYFLADHNRYFPKQYQFSESQQYDYVNNKLAYFGKMLVDHRPGSQDRTVYFDDDFKEKVHKFQMQEPGRAYLSQDYPYLHRVDEGSALRPFFDDRIDAVRPNIVLLVVESLSASLSGDQARYSSFTPFIDSLASAGLYWPNALSTSERTFGALPSLLGSLPPANTGFAEMADSMPPHLNLISLLKKNDYTTLFFYGGEAGFNNMNMYLNTGYIDYIETDFPGYEKMPTYSDGFTWGYGDKELYQYALDFLNEDIPEPYFSIFLTLSNHSPFMIIDGEYYEKLAMEKLKEYGFENNPGYTRKLDALKTHIYSDLTIREFFRKYQQRDDFDNTIFIITGDHITFAFPKNTPLETYHVPLIIYSPLLKQNLRSEQMVSHLDLAPALHNLLQGNDSISFPDHVHWLGKDLDTNRNFASGRFLAMMSGSRELSDYVYGDHFLSGETLYKIHDELRLELVNEPELLIEAMESREIFDQINHYACNTASIYPYNLYANWLKVVEIATYRNSFDKGGKDYGILQNYSKEAWSGTNCLVCDTTMPFSHILPETVIKYEVQKLSIRFEMMLKKHYTDELPVIVVSLQDKNDEIIYWQSFMLPGDVAKEGAKWHHFSNSLMLRINQVIEPGMVLKLYFWNKNKTASLLYDDIEVEISGIL